MLACPVQAAHKQQVIIAGHCAKVYDEGVTGTMGDDHTFTGALMTAAVRALRKHAGAADKRFIYVNVRECCVVNGSQRSFTRGCQFHSPAELEFFAQVHMPILLPALLHRHRLRLRTYPSPGTSAALAWDWSGTGVALARC